MNLRGISTQSFVPVSVFRQPYSFCSEHFSEASISAGLKSSWQRGTSQSLSVMLAPGDANPSITRFLLSWSLQTTACFRSSCSNADAMRLTSPSRMPRRVRAPLQHGFADLGSDGAGLACVQLERYFCKSVIRKLSEQLFHLSTPIPLNCARR
jgi:hypothetical protein